MAKNNRRNFLKIAAPAAALAVPLEAQQPAKKVYRRETPGKTPASTPVFNTAVSYGNLLFIAGMGAGAGFEGDIQAHTKSALDRLEAALKLAGSSMEKVLKVTVFLADPNDYQGMNEVYTGRFGNEPPVRSTVSVTAIPDHSKLEVECVAYI